MAEASSTHPSSLLYPFGSRCTSPPPTLMATCPLVKVKRAPLRLKNCCPRFTAFFIPLAI